MSIIPLSDLNLNVLSGFGNVFASIFNQIRSVRPELPAHSRCSSFLNFRGSISNHQTGTALLTFENAVLPRFSNAYPKSALTRSAPTGIR